MAKKLTQEDCTPERWALVLEKREWMARYRSDPHNREIIAARSRERYRRSPEVQARQAEYAKSDAGKASTRRYQLKKKYALSEDAYLGMLASQDHKCAICTVTLDCAEKCPDIDHCHETGVVRGVLCHACNILEGRLRALNNRLKERGLPEQPFPPIVQAYLDRTKTPI